MMVYFLLMLKYYLNYILVLKIVLSEFLDANIPLLLLLGAFHINFYLHYYQKKFYTSDYLPTITISDNDLYIYLNTFSNIYHSILFQDLNLLKFYYFFHIKRQLKVNSIRKIDYY